MEQMHEMAAHRAFFSLLIQTFEFFINMDLCFENLYSRVFLNSRFLDFQILGFPDFQISVGRWFGRVARW